MNLSPLPIQRFYDNNNRPLDGGLLFTYIAGTSTKLATYTDSTGITPNPNPIPLNYRGEAQVWIDPLLTYKFVLAPKGDTDPPTNPFWSVDQLASGLTYANLVVILTQQFLGQIIYPITAAEIAASVTPTNYIYLPLDPLRYGAIGDGVTDDTNAMNRWAAVVNQSTTPNSIWTQGKTYLCGPITTMTVNDLTLQMNGCTIKVKANSWPSLVVHVNFTGVRTRIYAGTIDGNQAAFSGAQSGFLLVVGNDFLLVGVTVKNSALVGMQLTNIVEGTATGCHFDSNANAGAVFATCSYLRFIGCTFNFNGYNFQGTYPLNGPGSGSFSLVLRFRCHHMYFTACESLKGGSDGFNINQGSYAIKLAQCVVWGATDGGFTIAADSTSPGTPGDGESCYDLEYVDCEAYDNWASGITAFQSCFNVTVEGGRYYNNGRGNGMIATTSALFNGIYIASGSIGVKIDTKAYDDRQYAAIQSVSGTSPRTLNASAWVTGTSGSYPRVALYNAAQVFQGYGTISSESAGQVLITTTANNGVTLASIAAGWFVTQRVQHNGVMLDNNVQGEVTVDGFGFRDNGSGFTGWKAVSGFTLAGQNVTTKYPADPNNELLVNPTFDAGVANWTLSQDGTTATMTAYTGANRKSAGAMQLFAGTLGSNADATLITDYLLQTAGVFVEASVWAFAVNPQDAELRIFINTGSSIMSSDVHTGGSKYQLLRVGLFIPATGNTNITFRLRSNGTSTNIFDTVSFRARPIPTDPRDTSYPTRNLPV
jgi:hypothetical protein